MVLQYIIQILHDRSTLNATFVSRSPLTYFFNKMVLPKEKMPGGFIYSHGLYFKSA